jgi:hypothetical protein
MTNILKQICELDENRSLTFKQFNNLYEDCDKLHNETFSAINEEYDKYIKCTKKYKHLVEVNDFIWEIYDDALEGMNKYSGSDNIFTLDKKLCSTIYVTRNKGAKIVAKNCCSMCLDTHDLKHLVKTSCGHYFGKQCFAALLKHKYYDDEEVITCPNCRLDDFSLQKFKYKK